MHTAGREGGEGRGKEPFSDSQMGEAEEERVGGKDFLQSTRGE